jgi:phosphohistidine phosphatase
MKLYLLRHGKAGEAPRDEDRELTSGGAKAIKKAAAFLKDREAAPAAIWQSGLVRAEQSAKIVAKALGLKSRLSQHGGMAPMDPVQAIRSQIEAFKGDLMLVGHQPFLGSLVSLLVLGSVDREVLDLRTSGVVCLETISKTGGFWKILWAWNPA